MSGHWLNPVGRPERVALPGDRPGSRSYRARMAGIDVVIAELGERQAGTMSAASPASTVRVEKLIAIAFNCKAM